MIDSREVGSGEREEEEEASGEGLLLPRVRGERRESVSHYSLLVSQPSESIYSRTESFEEFEKGDVFLK